MGGPGRPSQVQIRNAQLIDTSVFSPFRNKDNVAIFMVCAAQKVRDDSLHEDFEETLLFLIGTAKQSLTRAHPVRHASRFHHIEHSIR